MEFTNFGYILATLCLQQGVSAFSSPPVSRAAQIKSTISTSTKLNADEVEKFQQKTPSEREVDRWLNDFGEQSRLYRRDVYSAADWVRYRRPDRIFDNLATFFQSGLIRQVAIEVTLIFIVANGVCLWNSLLANGYDDIAGVHHDPLLGFALPAFGLPLTPFTIGSGSLGLLLAFRTNVSWKRWNEARTAWGKVINDSRSIVRMGAIWSKSYKNITDQDLKRLAQTVCTFSRSLMNRTLPPQEDEENFKRYTMERIDDQRYATALRNAKHRPSCALAELTQILVDFNLNPLHQVEVEQVVTGLCDALGASERIYTSPVPLFWTRHTARFLALWLLGLPLAMYEPFADTWNHFGMVPVMVVISTLFVGIEELATQMEEPFSILPMEKMCEGSIRAPIMELVERSCIFPRRDTRVILGRVEQDAC